MVRAGSILLYAMIATTAASAANQAARARLVASAGLVCTADRAINESTGDPVPVELRVIRHPSTDIASKPDVLIATYSRRNEHGGIDAEYRVNRATGRFTAEAIETRNDIGEEHRIRLTGRCTPARSG